MYYYHFNTCMYFDISVNLKFPHIQIIILFKIDEITAHNVLMYCFVVKTNEFVTSNLLEVFSVVVYYN